MSDLNLPPEQPLPERRKTEMRHGLLAAASHDAPGRRSRPWLVPGLAAASVLGIVAVGVGLAGGGGDDDGGGTTLQPAGAQGNSPDEEQRQTTPSMSTTSNDDPAQLINRKTRNGDQVVVWLEPDGTRITETYPASENPTGDENPSEPASCDSAVAEFARQYPPLDGAAITAERDYGPATALLYETKAAWLVCDEFAATDGGPSTLWNYHEKSASYAPSPTTLAISQNHVKDGAGLASQYVAGGRDFDGVRAIAYAFPDGHVEEAVVGRTGLWSMVYLPREQISAEDGPVEVTVDYTDAVGGGSETFTLEWGRDTCAQLNHGC